MLCTVGREWQQQIVEYVLELLLGTYGAVGWDEGRSSGRQANKLADSRVRPI